MGSNPSFVPEIGSDGLPRQSSVITYTEQIIEAEQLQLKKYIQENYTKIRDVERELANLGLEMKLTSGPKKAALEHMRKKIEASTEKIRVAKIQEEQARKVWESASKTVQEEEAIKQKLCEDLSKLDGRSSSLDSAIQGGSAGNVPYQNNGLKVPVTNEHKPQPPSEEGRNKKKVNYQRGKGIGAVPKTRSSTPDWTGAGFDVDGRT
ncbi:uncharacterized protein [Glycine max]|uniref:RAB6-interacting golgin n=1 Tax=Glycine max TaxID=3847 RepID=A0A0R0FSV0_SOYBN|nr:uncharacterized protein LOC100778211 isoform X2 [Glycine max]XP_040866556.1 uncharacterized protein LOC100778211 isoform X2 [Glycine max]XP_040866557.1 uncharacterized protein LOC100778211 isoform X2 [Glycine max]